MSKFLFLLIFSSSSLLTAEEPSDYQYDPSHLANAAAEPSSLIDECVSVFTGNAQTHIQALKVEGAEPLEINITHYQSGTSNWFCEYINNRRINKANRKIYIKFKNGATIPYQIPYKQRKIEGSWFESETNKQQRKERNQKLKEERKNGWKLEMIESSFNDYLSHCPTQSISTVKNLIAAEVIFYPDDCRVVIRTPDGGEIHYSITYKIDWDKFISSPLDWDDYLKGTDYLKIDKEILPNGHVIKYFYSYRSYNPYEIRSMNNNETITYAWIKLDHNYNNDVWMTTSHEKKIIKIAFKENKIKSVPHFKYSFPERPDEEYNYRSRDPYGPPPEDTVTRDLLPCPDSKYAYLTDRILPDGRLQQFSYYKENHSSSFYPLSKKDV